jgi:hypothetical protein
MSHPYRLCRRGWRGWWRRSRSHPPRTVPPLRPGTHTAPPAPQADQRHASCQVVVGRSSRGGSLSGAGWGDSGACSLARRVRLFGCTHAAHAAGAGQMRVSWGACMHAGVPAGDPAPSRRQHAHTHVRTHTHTHTYTRMRTRTHAHAERAPLPLLSKSAAVNRRRWVTQTWSRRWGRTGGARASLGVAALHLRTAQHAAVRSMLHACHRFAWMIHMHSGAHAPPA